MTTEEKEKKEDNVFFNTIVIISEYNIINNLG